MSELNMEKFNPTVAELTALVETTRKITAKDLTDKKQLAVVKQARIELKNARVRIEKAGKELRADAIKFQKDVIAKENELVGIVEPEELRLKAIEEEAAHLALMEVRRVQIPERKERLIKEGLGAPLTDEELLEMDSVQFEMFFNEAVAERNRLAFEEQQRLQAEKQAELDAKEAKIIEDQRKLDEEARAQEREVKAREDERVRLQREEDERKGREAKAKEEAEAKAKADAEEAERARIAKEAEIEGAKRYQNFLVKCGCTKENAADFKKETVGDTIILWKKMGVFKVK